MRYAMIAVVIVIMMTIGYNIGYQQGRIDGAGSANSQWWKIIATMPPSDPLLELINRRVMNDDFGLKDRP